MIKLQKGSLITLAGFDLTEHNRTPVQMPRIPVKTDKRLANGSLRRYFVIDKLSWSFSWERVPALDTYTVDGKAGRNKIRNIYEENIGIEVPLIIRETDASNAQITKNYTVFIDTFQDEIDKRFTYETWNVSMTLIEK